MLEYYKYKYYLNALHSFDDQKEHAHVHTFSFVLYIEAVEENKFVSFSEVDKLMQEFFHEYTGVYLNEHPSFLGKNPTIENIGDVFFEILQEQLSIRSFHLIQLEITENPVRVYTVSDRILFGTEYGADGKKRWEDILEKKQRFHLAGNKNNKGADL